MLDNYNNSWDCSGGVLFVASCASTAKIQRNYLWNRNVSDVSSLCRNDLTQPWLNNLPLDRRTNTYGFELFGRDITVQNNWIEYFTHEGIYAASVNHLDILSNRIRNNSRTFHAIPTDSSVPFEDDPAGVMIANSVDIKINRPVDRVTITGNEIGNIWNIYQSSLLS